MEIRAQSTPNPNALKFVLGGVRFERPLNFASADTAAGHPLAARLFALTGVYNVFFAQDFVTVNKRPEIAWDSLRSQIESTIQASLASAELSPAGVNDGNR